MRKNGILIHISSLPNNYGIGTMGKCAFDFVDFLKKSGQSFWQILPMNPTGYGDSPYQSVSSFAGNPYFIDLDMLLENGLLYQEEISEIDWGKNMHRVDFGCIFQNRLEVLKTASERFCPDQSFYDFLAENSGWLDDYCIFMALKERYGFIAWNQWPDDARHPSPETIHILRDDLKDTVFFYQFVQYEFWRQWERLHAYARDNGIQMIGDIPIYVPYDSVDVWSNQGEFLLDDDGCPLCVAGCPPDAFNTNGQLWGNPIYDWEKMKANGFDWWIKRMDAASQLYDVVRLDHFRGFESYWSIPANEKTAAGGKWVKGPGLALIQALQAANPNLKCIAEDLGYLTQEVKALQEASGYPGMKVLQFAFDSREESDYLPHHYTTNSVCYTGTHDNAPLAQWFHEVSEEDLEMAKSYLGLSEEEGYITGMIRGCMSSVSDTCIIPLQDFLELGQEARMNLPGSMSTDNWSWRLAPGELNDNLEDKIYRLTKLYGRISKSR